MVRVVDEFTRGGGDYSSRSRNGTTDDLLLGEIRAPLGVSSLGPAADEGEVS